MLVGTLNKIREEKASRIRDVEYIRGIAEDDAIEDRLFELELRNIKESGNIFAESARSVEQISVETESSKEEINRILNSDRKLSFDEILGITE